MRSTPISHRITLFSGGATSHTFELYQRRSHRCRVWGYCCDQDGMHQTTIQTFRERNWQKAVARGIEAIRPFLPTRQPKRVTTTKNDLDLRATGGPFIPKGTKALVLRERRERQHGRKVVWVDLVGFGPRNLYADELN